MKVVYDISDLELEAPVVLTQGTFDGVHYGHKKILKQVVNQAKEKGGVSVLLTFYPHPRLVLYPDDNNLKMLTTIEEKVSIIESLGIDYLVVLPFTKELSKISAENFVRDILVDRLKVSKLIIGYDHRFGRNREGSIEEMKQYAGVYNFALEEIAAQDIEDSIVSSTKIRKALLGGDVRQANEFLEKPYVLSGKVEEGLQRGTEIGFPTANIRVSSSYKLIPLNGVYAVWVYIEGQKYGGMLNVGYNPTFTDKNWSVEVHILDFSQNIYHKDITIEFIDRYRDEVKFESVEALVKQLNKDEEGIRKILEI